MKSSTLIACGVLAAIVSVAGVSEAQEKGAERLLKLQRLDTVADIQKVQPGDTVVMSCPKCKDTWVKVVQPPGKGGRVETASVVQHQCPSCGAKIETTGVGKQATTQVKHVCTHCGSTEAFCSVMKKGVATAPSTDEHKTH
jgi:predicted RNA-binding Zn-ribbon protein involved in translation (DUF1610 family)